MRSVYNLRNDIDTLKQDASKIITNLGRTVQEASKENSERLLHEAYDQLQRDFKIMQDKFEALSEATREGIRSADEQLRRNPYPYLLIAALGAFFLAKRTR